MIRALALISVVAALTVAASDARAEEVNAGHGIGVGYKIGNGLGFFGADVVARFIPHVAIDLQANYVSTVELEPNRAAFTATGYGLAPMVQAQWKTIGHTPYLGLGLVYVSESALGLTASATGLLFNAGYEWRFASGIGVLVGAGVADLGTAVALDRTRLVGVAVPGGWSFNIEAGVRYFF